MYLYINMLVFFFNHFVFIAKKFLYGYKIPVSKPLYRYKIKKKRNVLLVINLNNQIIFFQIKKNARIVLDAVGGLLTGSLHWLLF